MFFIIPCISKPSKFEKSTSASLSGFITSTPCFSIIPCISSQYTLEKSVPTSLSYFITSNPYFAIIPCISKSNFEKSTSSLSGFITSTPYFAIINAQSHLLAVLAAYTIEPLKISVLKLLPTTSFYFIMIA